MPVPVVFGLWRVCFPPCLVRPGRRLPVPVQGLSEGSLGCRDRLPAWRGPGTGLKLCHGHQGYQKSKRNLVVNEATAESRSFVTNRVWTELEKASKAGLRVCLNAWAPLVQGGAGQRLEQRCIARSPWRRNSLPRARDGRRGQTRAPGMSGNFQRALAQRA